MKAIQRILTSVFALFLFSPVLFSQDAESAAEHVRRKAPTIWEILTRPRFITKFVVMLLLGAVAFALLKSKKMTRPIKVILLLLALVLFGLLGNITAYFIMHPSPMCAATKSILYGFGIPLVITLAVIFLLTLVGPKLFCGWVCPVGAVQELIAMLSDKLGIKRWKFAFTAAQTVRVFIFLLFVFLSGTAIIHGVYDGTVYPLSIYDYINPFHGLEFGADENLLGYAIHYLPFLLTVILAFKLYRPFCHFVCPVGLYTHWLEQVSLYRITFKKHTCTSCNVCVKASPCTAIPEILKESTLRPDCYACNECIAKCPEGALEIGRSATTA